MTSRASDEIVAPHRFIEDGLTGRSKESAFDPVLGTRAERVHETRIDGRP